MNDFKVDIENIKEQARENMKRGAVTRANKSDVESVIKVLNNALATELVCVLRYKHNYFMAKGIKSEVAASEFLEHMGQEEEHADMLAERIVQLGGEPNFNPDVLSSNAHTEYKACTELRDMIVENLVAERVAVDIYTEMARWIGDSDPTTRRIIETVLAQEEEHADDMADLLE